jgi:hypothetical protein
MALLSMKAAIFAVVPVVIYLVIARVICWMRYRHIKGPPGAGWTYFWLVRHVAGGRLIRDLEDVCDHYGRYYIVSP